MTRTLTALYDNYASATGAVQDLEAAGVPHNDVSIVSNNADGRHKDLKGKNTAQDAEIGAGIGAVAGGTSGLLAGLGIMAIPGVGPVVAAGWLVATAIGAVAGGVVGGAAGGLVGSLTKAGVPEEDAHVYAEGVRRGGTVVTVRADDTLASRAQSILEARKSVDVRARGAAYRSSGWSKFNEQAAPFDRAQVEAERGRYVDPTVP